MPGQGTGSFVDWATALQLVDRQSPVVFREISQLRHHALGIAGAYALERAWLRMKLDAVVCSGSKPLVYIKTVPHYDRAEENRLHQELWNQDLAPVLLIVDPGQVRVYSARPAAESSLDRPRYIEAIDLASHALEAKFLVDRMQSGEYFSLRSRHFSRQSAVDRAMLKNLTSTRNSLHALDQRISHDRLHRLLICTIFLRYLIDRSALRPEYLARRLKARGSNDISQYISRDPQGRKHAFATLFKCIGDDLGGDLLTETARDVENGPLRELHFEALGEFLESSMQGQLALHPRWVYDVSFIPTETVSAIYQEFLSVEVEDAKHRLGTVATPRHIAEMMVDLCLDPSLLRGDGKILDPACGSGVFLVTMFNRIAFGHRAENPSTSGIATARSLTKVLQSRVFGVDISATSCHLTALNLVHSLLSHLTEEELSQVLLHKDRLVPPLFVSHSSSESNIKCGDFLQQRPSLMFQLIIGNPPWSKNTSVPIDEEELNDLATAIPRRGNLAHYFALKAPAHLEDGGRCCLLLDAKAMLASANGEAFLKEWFRSFRVEQIVNLTNLRSFLFETAGRAGAIFCIRKEEPTSKDSIRYRVPLPVRATKQLGILDAAPSTSFDVPYSELLRKDADLIRVWKVRQWGTARDIRLIERLATYRNLKSALDEHGGTVHQGFNIHGSYGEYKERSLLSTIPYLPSDRNETGDWSLVLPSKLFCRRYGDVDREQIMVRQWVSDEGRIFKRPRVIIHHSARSDPPGIRAAVTRDAFSFHKEILGLYFHNESPHNERRLYSLAAILSSTVVAYYLFHTSPTWGVESQPQIRVRKDLWTLPIPDLDAKPAHELAEVLQHLEKRIARASLEVYEAAVLAEMAEVERLVMEAYGIDSNECALLQRFMDVTIRSSEFAEERESRLDRLSSAGERAIYLKTLGEAILAWTGGRTGLRVQAIVSSETGLCLVDVTLDRKLSSCIVEDEIDGGEAFSSRMLRLLSVLRVRDAILPSYRNLLVFDGPSLFFSRPLLWRFWTQADALNDADFLAASLFKGRHSH